MTRIAARKQARRFFGTMGATMRRTSQWMEVRRSDRADATMRHAFGYPEDRYVGLMREAVAR
jgi:hypothetical protein